MATAAASDTFANSTTSSNTSIDLLSTPVTKRNQHHHRSEYPDKTAAAAAAASSKGGIGSGAGTPETVMAETPSPVASMSSPHASASRSAHRAASAQAAANASAAGKEEDEEEEESSLHSDALAAFEYSGSTVASGSTSAVVTSRNTSDNTTPAQAVAEAYAQATNMQASATSINTAATASTHQLAGLRILSGLSSTSPETIGPATVYTAGDGGDGDDGDDGDNSNASGMMDGSSRGGGAGGRLAEFLRRENLATREALLAEARGAQEEGAAAAAAQAMGDREERADQFKVEREQVKEEESTKGQKEDLAGITNKNVSGASPTKTSVVDAAVEASRKMAEVTAALNSPSAMQEPTLENKRSGSMEFGSMAEGSASISVTGSFTTDSAGNIVTNSTTVNADTSTEPSKSKSKKSKSKSKAKSKKSSSTTSKYTSDYAISNPSTKMKESMSTAEKLRAAEAEAARSSEGFVKVVNATEKDDDYVPVADFTNSAKKKKKSVDTISYDSADYAPESAFGVGGRGDSVQRYRMMLRKKKRRRRKMIIRAAVVVVFLLGAIWWWSGSGGNVGNDGDASIGEQEQATTTSSGVEQEDEVAAAVEPEVVEMKTMDEATVPDVSQPDGEAIIEADEPLVEKEATQEYEEEEEGEEDAAVVEEIVADAESSDVEEDTHEAEKEVVADTESPDVEEDTREAEEEEEPIDDAISTKGIKLDATPKKEAPIVKGLKAAKNINSEDLFLIKKLDTKAIKDAINKVEPRAVPFSHFFSKDVRSTAKTNPVLSNIDSFLESMMQ